eukprot:gene34760-42091_t
MNEFPLISKLAITAGTTSSSTEQYEVTSFADWKKLEELKNIGEGEGSLSSDKDCLHFVDLERYANDCISYINSELAADEKSTGAHRKRPLIITSFARGGKTTAICALFDKLAKQAPSCRPIAVTCNGSSNFAMLPGESQRDAIARLIVCQATGRDTQQSPVKCSDELINQYIGDQPCVLLIDELNVIANPLNQEASRFLKDLFIKKKNRMLVFSTHVPMTADAATENMMAELSNGGCFSITQPHCSDISQLQRMHLNCSGLTKLEAALYGYCPALIFCVKLGTVHVGDRFNMLIKNENNLTDPLSAKLFADLVGELITGKPYWPTQVPGNLQCHEHRRYYALSVGTFDENEKAFRLRWPLCYIKQIFKNVPPSAIPQDKSIHDGAIKNVLDKVSILAQQTDTGLEWEHIVHTALLIRFTHSVLTGAELPLNLGKFTTSERHVKHIIMPPAVTNMIEARDYISETLMNKLNNKPTVILFTPSAGGLNTLDGFAVYTPGANALLAAIRAGEKFDISNGDWMTDVKLVGFQCKAGKKTPSKDAPKFVHKAFLLRGEPVEKSKQIRGWEFYSRTQILDLLGWSLAPFLPAEISLQVANPK